MSQIPNDETNNSETKFLIQRVYCKNLSFETKNVPAIFQDSWAPDLKLDLNIQNQKLDQYLYEVVLTVTATVQNQNQAAFLVEVQQGGIFYIEGVSDQQLGNLLGSFCPSILFPYIRETISSEVTRGSFPQLVLSPINFDALYFQQLKEQESENVNH